MTLARCAFTAPNGARCPMTQTTRDAGLTTLPVFRAGYRDGLSVRGDDGTTAGFPACQIHVRIGGFPELHADALEVAA